MSRDTDPKVRLKPLQVAPLLIGYHVRYQPPGTTASSSGELLLGLLFVSSLVAVGGLVYWFHRSDQAFKKRKSLAGDSPFD